MTHRHAPSAPRGGRLSQRPAALGALAALALLLAWPGPADAQWKWRDRDGRITVSDLPPPKDVPEKDVLVRPSAPVRAAAPAAVPASAASAAARPAPPADRELEARKRAAEQERAARARADEDKQAAVRADNCRRARGQVAALESGQRMARFNDKGEREVLDDRARAEELARARAIVASDCR